MPSHDALSPQPPRRPTVIARHSSTSSQVSQTPSDGSSQHKRPPQRHVVGHRMGQRNPSFGRNLNKLRGIAPAQGTDGTAAARQHKRTASGGSTPVESPQQRPNMQRHASTTGIIRNRSHTALRKNHSSGHLSRTGSHKNVTKAAKADSKRSHAHPAKRHSSPDIAPAHPTVRFDVGDEEGVDDGNDDVTHDDALTHAAELGHIRTTSPERRSSGDTNIRSQPDGKRAEQERAAHINGASSYHSSKVPDADAITSRLLQRNSARNAPPKISSVSATVVPDSHDARQLSQSQGSNHAETPGRDLVSRFIDEDEDGTPRDSSFLPQRSPPKRDEGSSDSDAMRRNKSAPNMAAAASASQQSRAQPSQTAGTTTSDLHPSRTQQKLWLQRASSNIEPQKLILSPSINYAGAAEGRIDPRLQRQFDQAALEYKVVRRYRNPVADAIVRLAEIPGSARKRAAARSSTRNGYLDSRQGSHQSYRDGERRDGRHTPGGRDGTRTPARDGRATPGRDGRASPDPDHKRKVSKVSFDVAGRADDDDIEGRQSLGSDGQVDRRDELAELCRRIWETVGVSEVEVGG
ncbi:hypothetical protein H2199_006057 [Coniosporium tulheliwenetii]|uniref:Uncharacterized protein n=1 Tax=Coniosporium tulheliwenetii TaxID=3383036 RepID=A0ACC2YYI1_9PEZI|nr:hypothetical protein H2199_006057 [Cladosporium sp. JES 115]